MSLDVSDWRPTPQCPACGSLLHSRDTPPGMLECSSARCGQRWDAWEVVPDV